MTEVPASKPSTLSMPSFRLRAQPAKAASGAGVPVKSAPGRRPFAADQSSEARAARAPRGSVDHVEGEVRAAQSSRPKRGRARAAIAALPSRASGIRPCPRRSASRSGASCGRPCAVPSGRRACSSGSPRASATGSAKVEPEAARGRPEDGRSRPGHRGGGSLRRPRLPAPLARGGQSASQGSAVTNCNQM